MIKISEGVAKRVSVLGFEVSLVTRVQAVEQVFAWANSPRGRFVCAANVHMVMEAHDDRDFAAQMKRADLVVPDGMPLVWAQHIFGHASAERIRGPDLMVALLEGAAATGVPVGLYGASSEVITACLRYFGERFPALNVACAISPPFRALTVEEVDAYAREINEAGARILFVSLGCPKQEKWMAENVGRMECVMIGVGAAFDFLAGSKAVAPQWMQRTGLEWAFRLATEPRRLWRRYLIHNSRFVFLFLRHWVRSHMRRGWGA